MLLRLESLGMNFIGRCDLFVIFEIVVRVYV